MRNSLDLSPGDSLGQFQLGSLLFNVLNHIRSYRDLYPSCKLSWHDQSPSSSPIHLVLSTPPLTLSFDPLSQRLSRIQLGSDEDSPSNWITYRGKRLVIDQDEEQDVVRVVRKVFGPTYGSSRVNGREGKDEEDEEEMLSYPGVALGVKKQTGSTKGSRLNRIILTPLPSPPNIPVDQPWLHPSLSPSPPIAAGDLHLAEILLDPITLKPSSIVLKFHQSTESEIGDVELRIGETTSEDLLCDLGNASRCFWKEDDRMSIHTSSSNSTLDSSLQLNPYFLSYPSLGLTLLLQPPTSPNSPSLLSKVILHSNLPGQVNFGRTARCAWTIRVKGTEEGVGGEEAFESVREVLRGNKKGVTGENEGGRGRGGVSIPTPIPLVTTSSKKKKNKSGTSTTKEIDLLGSSLSSLDSGPTSSSPSSSSHPRVPSPLSQQHVALDSTNGESGQRREIEEEEKPMILDRTAFGTDVGGGSEGRGKTTEIHGFDGIAFEVTGEGDIETVWLS